MEKKLDGSGGHRSSDSSSSSSSSRSYSDNGRWVTDNGNIPERVLVVGDIPGKDAKTGDSEKPCIERSQGGLCIERTKDKKIRNMKPSVQKLAEELLYTLQERRRRRKRRPHDRFILFSLSFDRMRIRRRLRHWRRHHEQRLERFRVLQRRPFSRLGCSTQRRSRENASQSSRLESVEERVDETVWRVEVAQSSHEFRVGQCELVESNRVY